MSHLGPIYFDQPGWLLLLLLVVPVLLMALTSRGVLSRSKLWLSTALRILVVILITVALAQPSWRQPGQGVTATLIIDRSQSIPMALKKQVLESLENATQAGTEDRLPEDRLAVVTVAREAIIAALPHRNSMVTVGRDVSDLTATNLAEAVRVAHALMPDDTANRIVIASDGNETIDSVAAAARQASASQVPIDVLILPYEYGNEVVFESLVAEPIARQGQNVTLRMVLHSTSDANGMLSLKVNGQPVALSESADKQLPVSLKAGTNVYRATIPMMRAMPHRFEARFTPSDPSFDAVIQNNSQLAVTFVKGRGQILIIDDGQVETEHLSAVLREAGLEVTSRTPGGMGDLLDLIGFDAVVLAGMPRWAFSEEQDRALYRYVHDIGGGLIALGGPQAFGAGGWIGSHLSRALPVRLDPPAERQIMRGALALIMHSCEMPQGNYWGQRVAEAAISALSRLDMVGIIEQGFRAGGANSIQGAVWALPMQEVGDKQAAIAATRKLQLGDMQNFAPAMQLALRGLISVNAGQKHAIIISDGDPQPPPASLLAKYRQANVSVSTVLVGAHGNRQRDRNTMQSVANGTGGSFYPVTNLQALPSIFIKEAQLVSRSLIQEGRIFQPQAINLPGPTEGFSSVPSVGGYVLTAERVGLTQTPLFIKAEADDPLLAFWNFGLGRSLVFTSDLSGRWGSAWASWPEFNIFWEQCARWVMRPTAESNTLIRTRIEGEEAIVDLQALDDQGRAINHLQQQAMVIPPGSGEPIALTMDQVGPGRYQGQFKVSQAGHYLVNIVHANGTIPAAVCVPYSKEYRAIRHNEKLLRELAEQTGGRVMNFNKDGTLPAIFERAALEIPFTPTQMWDLLAILAAALFLVDVAIRRLAIDWEHFRAWWSSAIGQRTEGSAESVLAWKRARSQASGQSNRKGDKATSRTRFVKSESISKDVQRADPSERSKAGLEKPGSTVQDAKDDQSSHTARLLRIKRNMAPDDEGPESS
ncbi:MAG: VWA domain-containing protein [Phycisphaerales bacterium]|nr:VWA domain-containing protein [Phycisphaerales bacterium]